MQRTLSKRELATILYALRQMQGQMICPEAEQFIDVEGGPLMDADIDDLCERLNFGD